MSPLGNEDARAQVGMKHAITILLLFTMGYVTCREWPRTMKVWTLSEKSQRKPLTEWKTVDYDVPKMWEGGFVNMGEAMCWPKGIGCTWVNTANTVIGAHAMNETETIGCDSHD